MLDQLLIPRPDLTYLVVGKEVAPTTGTRHLQGFVILANPQRRQWLVDLLGQAHYEIARGTSAQCADYCKKDGDFIEEGTFPASQGKRSDIDAVIEWCKDFVSDNKRAPNDRELAEHQPKAFLLYSKRLSNLCKALAPPPVIREGTPNEWQNGLVEAVQDESDDRSIIFYVDENGGKGKTWVQQYLVTKHPAEVQILGIGKRDDLAHAIDPTKRIFLINVPRGNMEFLQYSILEQLKDQMIFSPKYESQMKTLPEPPHVIVFSNEHPDLDKMSNDRALVTELN